MAEPARPAAPAVRIAAALLALVLLALAFQGTRGLWSPDEGRYVDVALQMLATGDWIHPRLHHEVAHFTKPPLTYWALASSLGGLGHSEFAARLPNGLAWLATVLLVFAAARHLEPARAWLPPLVYAGFLLPFLAANVVTTDTLLAATVALYAYGFIAAGMAPSPRERGLGRWLLWLGVALAFLAKGPPGLLPLAGLLAFAWTQRREQPLRATYLRAAPLAIAAVLAFAWYAKVAWDRPDLLRYFLVEEVWNRVASDSTHRNAHWHAPLTIYLPSLLLGSLPWTWPLLRTLGRAATSPRATLADAWADPAVRRLLLWFGLPLLVFMLAKSRLPLYLLPLFQPLAFAVARCLRGWRPPRALPFLLATWFALLLALRFGAALLDRPEDDRALAAEARALGLASIDEIAFVDSAPRYGLSFYLGAEVERIGLPGAPLPPQSESLRSELADDEGCRLLLVESGRATALRATLPGAWREPGGVGPYRSFVADDDACTLAPDPGR
jgi:4-amino-4-deoxy-L-arabinose transferase